MIIKKKVGILLLLKDLSTLKITVVEIILIDLNKPMHQMSKGFLFHLLANIHWLKVRLKMGYTIRLSAQVYTTQKNLTKLKR